LLDALVAQKNFTCLLTYGVLNGLDHIFQAASIRNLKVVAIIWLDTDASVNQLSISNGIQAAKNYPNTIIRLSCGSEFRTRHGTGLDAIIRDCLTQVRAAGVTQPLTSIDTWWEWCNRSWPCQIWDMANDVDWIGINVFPWWENKFSGIFPCTPVNHAADFHIARLQDAKSRYPGKEVILTEFGWPAGPDGFTETNQITGQKCNGAEASEINQRRVVIETLTKLDSIGFRGIVFEAFREAWKVSEGAVGPFWGICAGTSPYTCKSLLRQAADADNDGKNDLAVYQKDLGNWFYVRSTLGFSQHLNFGGGNFLPVPGDYDGDGQTDTAVYDMTNGNWFIDQSTAGFRIQPAFGGAGFIPVPADYDGDGKTDLGVYQVNTGHWFFVRSTLGFGQHLGFGGFGFVPVPGDYDGDGKADTAVYNTINGNWFIAQSSAGFKIHPSFGGPGFIPVPGDYDGDGKMDVAVYQTSTGHWFYVGSTTGFGSHLAFGGSAYMPVPGDYDGDGQTDIAVYQTSTGNWFISQSTAGFRIHGNFGGVGFVPVLPQVTILRGLGVL
jgi:exo-beta-1,3-glucanase (GH17 family)